jgi:predicted PurR-regulated permease PerM
MAFSLDEFYQLNRRALIWLILAALLWVLRDFFGLIFLTFVLVFIASPLVRYGQRWLRLPYRISLIFVYMLFVLILVGFVRYVTPNVIVESNRLLANLGQVEQRIVELKNDLVDKYPGIKRSWRGYIRSFLDEQQLAAIQEQLQVERQKLGLTGEELGAFGLNSGSAAPDLAARIDQYYAIEDRLLIGSLFAQQAAAMREHVPRLINLLYQALATMLLALLFSFLILLDIARLEQQVKSLEASKLKDFYQETASPVVRFGYVIGRGIQAQATIAVVNTILTVLGLLLLSIPSIAMLSLIVFVCSFIPVLGVFISTAPILLVALNTGGLQLALLAVAMIIIIHAIEAYLLNPLIYGRHFKLNPVIVLMILIVGYHLFGIWGLLLGVPVAQYFLHQVFGVPVWRDDQMAAQN